MATAKIRRLLPYMYGKEALVLGFPSSQVLIPIENCKNISFAAQVRRNLPRKFIFGCLWSQVRRQQKITGSGPFQSKLVRRQRNDSKEPIAARLCSLAGRYDNPIPTRFLAPIDCLKIQTHFLTFPLLPGLGRTCHLGRAASRQTAS
jgi:hypothetical protein